MLEPPEVKQRFLRGSARSLSFRVSNRGRVPATGLRFKMPQNQYVKVTGLSADSDDDQGKRLGTRVL